MSFNHSTFPPTVLDNNNNLYFILITITYITTAIHAISITPHRNTLQLNITQEYVSNQYLFIILS